MNPEIKARWVRALREGQLEDGTPIEQGKRRLETEDGKFCCLGVLCKIAVADGVIERRIVHDPHPAGPAWPIQYGTGEPGPFGNWESSILPFPVAEWAGLNAQVPRPRNLPESVWPADAPADLTLLNDGYRNSLTGQSIAPLTFAQIADVIEASL